MYEGLTYEQFSALNRVRFVGAGTSLIMGEQMKSAIFTIRAQVSEIGKSINMDTDTFANFCVFPPRKDMTVYVGHIVNTLKRQNLVLMTEKYTEGNFQCYGTPTLILTGPDGKEYTLPQIFAHDTPDSLRGKYDKMNHYYVYVCRYKGVVVYVGKGSKERLNHCTSGKSSSKELNVLVASGAEVFVEKIAENLTEDMAMYLESSYIKAMINSGHQLYNKKLPSDLVVK